MSGPPRHSSYNFEGYYEVCLGFGDTALTRTVLIVPPLFDEMNRVRAMLVGAMRELAGRDVRTLLPDLPGCNESLAPIATQSIENWQRAVAAAADQLGATHVASIRGGGLIVARVNMPKWQLAPVKGASLLKTMLRTRIASDKEAGLNSSVETLMSDARSGTIDLSGYSLGAEMIAGLDNAAPTDKAFEMALGDEPGQLAGKPLWLRAEPQEDPQMSAALAAELDRWSASCGG